MKDFLFIVIAFAAFFLVSCVDEVYNYGDDDAPFSISITSAWQVGRAESTSRALPDYLLLGAPSTPDPAWIYISVPEKDDFYVTKLAASEPSKEPGDPYISYHKFYSLSGEELKKCPISRGDARKGGMAAYYFVDGGDAGEKPADSFSTDLFSSIPAIGTCDYMSSDITGYPVDENHRDHLLFTMLHRTALIRLRFAVDEDYLKIRDIVLRNVTINDQSLYFGSDPNVGGTSSVTLPGLQLTATPTFCACAYVNPTSIKASDQLTFKCTYDIYDKDGITEEHCTRKGVTATNRVVLKNLTSSSISELKAGYYYDLSVTIDPDYLYVLSEHDNKHLVIE